MPVTIPVRHTPVRYHRRVNRRCYRVGCQGAPVSTLTYNYAHSTATLGPLRPEHDPGDYDLCLDHARHLQVPSGWTLERVSTPEPAATAAPAWLNNLADEVRRIGWGDADDEPAAPRRRELADEADAPAEVRRGHLRVLADLP